MLKVGDRVRIIGKSRGGRTEDIGKEDIIEYIDVDVDEYVVVDCGIYPESSLQRLERQIEIRGKKFSEETIAEALKAYCNFDDTLDEYKLEDITLRIDSVGFLEMTVKDSWAWMGTENVDELIEKLQLLRAKMK